ncbi:hypothetical protein ACI8AK_10845 [Geodermatophilus sp. SYSU D00867]
MGPSTQVAVTAATASAPISPSSQLTADARGARLRTRNRGTANSGG